MNPKIDSMHFVFWFKPGSFALAHNKFVDFLSKFSNLVEWSQYILPLEEEVNWDFPIMSLDWKDTRIVVSKERLNVFFEDQKNWGDLHQFMELIKQIYQKFKDEMIFEIDWIGFITYNHLQDIEKPTNWTYFIDYLNRDKRGDFLSWEWVKTNIRIEKKKDLSIGKCNYIINTIDAKIKDNEENISVFMFDINTKAQTQFIMNEDNLNNFFSVYEDERSLSLNLFN